jgi:hypothetical protein
MVTNKTPEVERCDGQRVIAAEQIRAFHSIPWSRVYLQSQQKSTNHFSAHEDKGNHKGDLLVQPKHQVGISLQVPSLKTEI